MDAPTSRSSGRATPYRDQGTAQPGRVPRSPPSAENVRRDFRIAIKGAEDIDPAEWTPRELRHSFASLLSAHDVPVEQISRLVGHAVVRLSPITHPPSARATPQRLAAISTVAISRSGLVRAEGFGSGRAVNVSSRDR
ncbi:tyrosine-type recombinase/integrase [Microbispora triticiradicis]|uniref:tyrosine-type recombinase/integrase n=1 Tax=Microbispora triticiradicis TaxID=2200763 RepID=UPI001FCC377D|nr:tyrosine-type recombinase/integrase [Microbispora triticiradicis]MBO4269270.1 tyrosine-type recombinase/integrase [Microbispora triticiradicis]